MKMATVLTTALAEGLILSPERYDPRRQAHVEGVPVSAVAELVVRTLRPSVMKGAWRVLDTTHAEAGVIRCDRPPITAVGSTKKPLSAGTVIISRLRSYRRQIALVDPGLFEPDTPLCCSTEFYVLRSVDAQSIAFLVPFLLSAPVQEALAAGQEGGHHPRFSAELLLSLRIPADRMARRAADSAAVEAAVKAIRTARSALTAMSGT